MTNILVTGANGQIGNELRAFSSRPHNFKFYFTDVDELDITNEEAVHRLVKDKNINFCINCAAYTAVDHAETEKDLAYIVNAEAPGILAKVCSDNGAVLIQFSTDFVFDGKKGSPYLEDDATTPLSVYGDSKLLGEVNVRKNLKEHIIIRTSWVFSSYGHNFVKTMRRLGKLKGKLSVISDQIGTPTYAYDLAKLTIDLITNIKKEYYGTFHYSNEGVASWYDFAYEIMIQSNIPCELTPITTSEYPTPATRPPYSVLNKTKFKKTFNIPIPHWRESLNRCISRLEQKEQM